MKSILKIAVSVLLVTVMALTLVSCGNKPSGTYKDATGLVSLKFSGSDVTYTFKIGSVSTDIDGTFKMDDNNISITWTDDEGKENSVPSGLVYDNDADTVSLKVGIISYTLKKA